MTAALAALDAYFLRIRRCDWRASSPLRTILARSHNHYGHC